MEVTVPDCFLLGWVLQLKKADIAGCVGAWTRTARGHGNCVPVISGWIEGYERFFAGGGHVSVMGYLLCAYYPISVKCLFLKYPFPSKSSVSSLPILCGTIKPALINPRRKAKVG